MQHYKWKLEKFRRRRSNQRKPGRSIHSNARQYHYFRRDYRITEREPQ